MLRKVMAVSVGAIAASMFAAPASASYMETCKQLIGAGRPDSPRRGNLSDTFWPVVEWADESVSPFAGFLSRHPGNRTATIRDPGLRAKCTLSGMTG